MHAVTCVFHPSSCLASVASSSANTIFSAFTNWIVASVQWLLSATAAVLNTASQPATIVNGAQQEFTTLLVLSPGLLMIGLLVSTLQALRHGDGASLWRVYLGVAPACVAGIALARPLALLILQAVDQMSAAASAGVAERVSHLAVDLSALAATTPSFALFALAAFLVLGTFLLWCELIVRTVVLTLLLVLVPLVVPLSTFPSLRRISWRLAETFLALAVSKLILVVTLTLGLDELTTPSPTAVITGAVTIILATFTPFVLLRVVPVIETAALHNLEGLRSRATATVANASSSPAARVAQSLKPDVTLPTPPARPDDLGLETWPGVPETSMPPLDGERPRPPIGTPQLRGGHVVYGRDHMGPVVGWHFDE